MKLKLAAIFMMGLGVTACTETTGGKTVDPLTAALSGKSLVNGDDKFDLGADGSLMGVGGPGRAKFVGTWEIVDGQWCRDFSEPAQWAGRECQPTVLGDNSVTLTGRNGPKTWMIE